jgi:hypothetical protein
MTEHQFQASIIAEVNLRAKQDPRWNRIFAVPNGGKRDKVTASLLKAEGVRRGVPDLWWPLRARGYVGLIMELKVNGGLPTKEQEDWAAWLTSQGWLCLLVQDDATATMNVLTWYLDGAE